MLPISATKLLIFGRPKTMQFKDNKLERATLKTFALPHFCQLFLKTYCIVGNIMWSFFSRVLCYKKLCSCKTVFCQVTLAVFVIHIFFLESSKSHIPPPDLDFPLFLVQSCSLRMVRNPLQSAVTLKEDKRADSSQCKLPLCVLRT